MLQTQPRLALHTGESPTSIQVGLILFAVDMVLLTTKYLKNYKKE